MITEDLIKKVHAHLRLKGRMSCRSLQVALGIPENRVYQLLEAGAISRCGGIHDGLYQLPEVQSEIKLPDPVRPEDREYLDRLWAVMREVRQEFKVNHQLPSLQQLCKRAGITKNWLSLSTFHRPMCRVEVLKIRAEVEKMAQEAKQVKIDKLQQILDEVKEQAIAQLEATGSCKLRRFYLSVLEKAEISDGYLRHNDYLLKLVHKTQAELVERGVTFGHQNQSSKAA